MAIELNHTIVSARDPQASAAFLADMLGLPAPTRFGPFHCVALDNGVTLDFLHDLHGWLMMPAGLALLGVEVWVLRTLVIDAAPVRI